MNEPSFPSAAGSTINKVLNPRRVPSFTENSTSSMSPMHGCADDDVHINLALEIYLQINLTLQ